MPGAIFARVMESWLAGKWNRWRLSKDCHFLRLSVGCQFLWPLVDRELPRFPAWQLFDVYIRSSRII
jgi:hypothetical protein